MSNVNSDLVALLIRDNRAVWDKLLNNKFCQMMGQAKPGDKRVTKGFKWYMIVSLRFPSRADF